MQKNDNWLLCKTRFYIETIKMQKKISHTWNKKDTKLFIYN